MCFKIVYYILMGWGARELMPPHTNKRSEDYWQRSFLFTMWVPGITLNVVWLHGGAFIH